MKGTITINLTDHSNEEVSKDEIYALNIITNVEAVTDVGAITIIKSLMDSLEFTGELSTVFAMMLLGKIPWPFDSSHESTPLDMEGDCCHEG